MNFKGSIVLNDSPESGVPELLKAILNQLIINPIKLAMWLIEDIDLFNSGGDKRSTKVAV